MPLGDSIPAQRNEKEVQENKSSCHNSGTAALPNVQTTSQALTKHSPSLLHHTCLLLGRARFTAQPLSALIITKFSRMDGLPNFVTHGAPLRALRGRESSAVRLEYACMN